MKNYFFLLNATFKNIKQSLPSIGSLVLIAFIQLAASDVFGQTTQNFTTGTGTWTAPCDVTSITVEVWGAGGKGGTRSNNGSGGGGGGGAYSKSTISVTPGTTYFFTAGTGATTTAAGGDSYFGNTAAGLPAGSSVLAKGGNSVANNSTAGASGGAAASGIGTIKFSGGNGRTTTVTGGGGGGSSAGTAADGTTATSSTGATAPTGGGNGGGGRTGTQGDGTAGSAPGGGGGGGYRTSGTKNGGAGGSGKVSITFTSALNYCVPTFPSGVEPITNVTFAGINNTTSATVVGGTASESFCATASVQLGGSYAISLKGNTDGDYTDYIRVYIDWDKNGVFGNNTNEIYDIGTIVNSTGTDAVVLTGTIAVPSGATVGDTRMRVIKRYTAYGDACNTGLGFGQAEDYNVNVTAAATPTITSLGAASGCVGSSLVITGTNLSGATSATIGGTAATIATSTATTVTVTVGSGTTGTVQVTTAGGTATSSDTFTVNSAPPAISGGSATVCTGANTAAFTNATSGGTWSITNGTGTATISAGGIVTGTTAGTATVVYTVSGCSSSTPITITTTPSITTNPVNASIAGGANTSFTIAASNTPTSYTWQVSTDGGTSWTTISNGGVYSTATTATLTITGATIGMNGYLYKASATNDCGPSSFSTNATLTINYCTPTYTSGPGTTDGITNVTLLTLNNTSGNSTTPYYTFFNAVTIPDLNQSSTPTISITYGSDANQWGAVWIDFNQNGLFEASEGFVSTANAGASGTSIITITVPAGALLGNTRMRVRGGNDNAITTDQACGASSSGYGETEDYLVNIIAPAACAPPTDLTTSNLTSTSATISWTAPVTAPSNGYEYYISDINSAPTGAGTATSGTSVGLTGLTANTTYYFWVRSNCGGSETSTWTSSNLYTGYCVPTGTSSTYHILSVTTTNGVTNITNATGSNSGYGNFTAQSVSNYIGGTTNFSLTHTATGLFDGAGVSVFIDWNNDLDFNDVGENVLQTTAYNYSPFTGSFTVPAGTSNGNYRMRVVLDYNSTTPIACPSGITGETEDYTFTVVTDTSVRSVASGDWNSGSTWNTNVVPTCSNNVVIMGTHTVTVNSSNNESSNLTINSGGTLVVASGDLTVGCTLNNTPLTNNGTLTTTGGTLNINGNLSSALGSVFNQSGGTINIDGNNGGSTTGSVGSGTPLLNLLQLNSGINWTGGTLTIVDPHTASTNTNGYAVFYNNATAGTNYPSANHTIQFGNGTSTDAGGHTSGFYINSWVDTALIPFGSCNVNGPTGTNRLVTSPYHVPFKGNVTVNNGGIINFIGNQMSLAGNLNVNSGGTLISLAINLQNVTANDGLGFTGTAVATTQSIGGSGTFQNLETSPTANLTDFSINNSSAGGVTMTAPLSISGTLNMFAGKINTTATNVLTLGTATAAGTLTYTAGQITGPFARTFAASRTASSTWNATTLFPVGDGTNYIPIYIDPSTSAGGAVVMRGQAFNTNSGTAGVGVASALSNDRWEAIATSGSANLTNCFIRFYDAQIVTGNIIVQASSAAGVYNTITPNSTVATGNPNIRTATAIAAASYLGYFTYANRGPVITSFTPTSACSDVATTITITGTDLGSATSVTLNGEACTIVSNTATQIVVTTDATPQTGNIVVTTSANSVVSSTALTVNPSLPASVSVVSDDADNAICAGTSVTFTATPTNEGTTPTYQWFVGTTPVGTNSNTYTSTTLANNDVVTVRMTSNATPCLTGSPATSTGITMTVNPIPTTANAGPDQLVCSTNTITLAGNTATSGTGAWSIISGTGGTVTTPSSATSTFTGTAGTTYTLRWTISSGVCTASTDDVVITIFSPLDFVNLQFPGTSTICQGNSLTAYGQVYEAGVTTLGVQGSGITVEFGYDATSNDPSTWTNWFGATYNASSANNNNDEYQYTFTPSASGTYYYTFRYKQGACDWQYGGYSSGGGGTWGGSNVSGVLTVNSNAAHTISLSSGSATSAVCQNTALGTNIVYAIGGGATGAGVTGLPSGMLSSFSSGNFTISGTPTTSGTFNYTVTTTGNGCASAVTASGTITVSSALDYVNLQFPGSGAICESGTFTAYGQVYEAGVTTLGVQGSGITVEFGYNATNNDPSTWTNWFGATYNASSVNNNNDEYLYTFTPPSTGTYYYTFRYKQGACDWQYGGYSSGGGGTWGGSNVSGVLTVNPNPTATISGNSGAICNNRTATFTLSGTSGAVVTYTINGGANQTTTLTSGAATVTIPNATANQTLNLVSVSLGSCSASLSNSSTVTVGAVATWNGTSWVGTPAANMGIVFNGTYTSSGTIEGCNCTVNSGNVTIASGDTMLLSDELTVTGGTFTVENNASLIQTNNVTNTGNITYKRTSPLTVNTTDYVYWASPVSAQTIPNGLNYFWNNAAGTSGNWAAAAGQTMDSGRGFIMRGVGTKNFTGVPFNGEIPVNVYRRAVAGYNDNWNLVGNPYPSAISADEFLADLDNAAIEGSIAIWTHGSAISSGNSSPFYGTFTYNYNPADYIIYNTFADQTGPSSFGGNIAAGQGFFIKYDETAPTAASSTIKFKNSMRTDASGNSYGNSQFYRSSQSAQSIEKHRIWLDFINGANPATSRTVVGYADLATAGKDRLFDAATAVTASNASMYSLIGTDKMSIQAKGLPFTDQETIPMGYNAPQAGNYTVAIHAVDGLFNTQNIYLEDTQLNVIHDIKLAPYTFTATQGENNTRFILRFTNQTLGNEDFTNENAVTVYANDAIHVAAINQTIKSVRVFDLLGRVIGTFNKVNATSFTSENINKTQSALIVEVTLENGFTKTYKIIF